MPDDADVLDSSARPGPPNAVEQLEADADRRGEELEDKINDARPHDPSMTQAAARLQQSAESLERAGIVRISGSAEIASVLGEAMRLLGDHGRSGVDYRTAGDLLGRAAGVEPSASGQSPVTADLARFGLFLDQAAKAGLSPTMTEAIAAEVKTAGVVSPALHSRIVTELGQSPGFTPNEAEQRIDRLETAARLLPDSLTAQGNAIHPEANE